MFIWLAKGVVKLLRLDQTLELIPTDKPSIHGILRVHSEDLLVPLPLLSYGRLNIDVGDVVSSFSDILSNRGPRLSYLVVSMKRAQIKFVRLKTNLAFNLHEYMKMGSSVLV